LTDSYNNRVPFGTAIGLISPPLPLPASPPAPYLLLEDVSLRDSQRGASSANYYPQYPSPQPPQQQFNPSPFASPSPYGAPSPHTPSPLAPRPSMGAGPGMVPYGTPSHSMGMESGLSSLPSCSSLAHTSHFCQVATFHQRSRNTISKPRPPGGRRMEGEGGGGRLQATILRMS
jgi:hypothetical protein